MVSGYKTGGEPRHACACGRRFWNRKQLIAHEMAAPSKCWPKMPRQNALTGLWEVHCPNGEVLTNTSHEQAYQSYLHAKKEMS